MIKSDLDLPENDCQSSALVMIKTDRVEDR